MASSGTASGTSYIDLSAMLQRRRRELGVSSARGNVHDEGAPISRGGQTFEQIGEMAREHLRERGLLDRYEAFRNMSEAERLQARADAENKVPGDLDKSVYDCPDCLNRGYTVEIDGDELVRRKCKCMVTRRTIRRIRGSGLEAAIDEYRFDNFRTDEPFQRDMKGRALRFLSVKDRWFGAFGQSGCGKTHICTAVVRQRIRQGCDVIYMPYRDEIMRIKQSAGEAGAYQSRMEQLKRVDTLYIDDLFKGNITGADVNAVYELIGYRYTNHLETIISTEMPFDGVRKVDEAVAGRIYERCGRGEFVLQIAEDSAKNYRLGVTAHAQLPV